jgi:hypothetical protein
VVKSDQALKVKDKASAKEIVTKEDQVIQERSVVEKLEEKLKNITNKLDEADLTVKKATDEEEEKLASGKVAEAKLEAKAEVAKSEKNMKDQIDDEIKEAKKKLEEKKEVLLQGAECFYLLGKDENNKELALTASKRDLYHPLSTGVYNAYVGPWVWGNKQQLWKYDDKKDTIISHFYKDNVLTEGVKHNLFLYYDLGIKSQ